MKKASLPATAEEYRASLQESVMDKVSAGEAITNRDSMILNGYVEIADPDTGALKQVKIEDAFRYLKSLEGLSV